MNKVVKIEFVVISLLLSASLLCRAASLTWDANTSTAGPQDGTGSWSALASNTNWFDGSANVTWNNATPDSATFGAGNGAASDVTIPSNTTNTVGNITFNAPGSGSYGITASSSTSSKLALSGTPTITVTNGQSASITVVLVGTTFTKAGDGTLTINPGNPVITSGDTLVNGGTLVMGTSSSGRLIIPGNLTVTNGSTGRLGASDVIADAATVTVSAGSTFDMNTKSETITSFVMDDATVLQAGTETMTILGTLDARAGKMSGGTGKLDAGMLTKNTTGTVTLGSRGSSATSGGITNLTVNDGTLILDYTQSSSKINDGSGSLTLNGGTTILTNGTHTETLSSVVVAGGVITNINITGGVKISLPSGNYDVRSGAVYVSLAGAAGLTKSTAGTATLGGVGTFTGDTRIGNGVLVLDRSDALSSSTVDMNAADSGTLNFGTMNSASLGGLKGSRNLSVTNVSGGVVILTVGGNNQTTAYSGALSGNGSINKAGSGTLTLSGNLTGLSINVNPATSGTLIFNGVSDGPASVNGGTLGGNGTVGGSLIVNSGGRVSPGSSVGVLSATFAVTLNDGGTTFMEIDKTGGTNDLLKSSTTVTYGGTLSVTNISVTSYAAGDVFKLFQASTYTGSFTNIIPAVPGNNLAWDTSSLVTNGILKVVTASASSPTLNFTNNTGSLSFSWAGAFKLQSQTNPIGVGLVLSNSAWSDYPGGGSSPVTVSIDTANGSVFFRLSQ